VVLSAVLLLGAGSYLLRVLGLQLVSTGRLPAWADVPLRNLPASLLAALIATMLATGGELPTLDARLLGVLVAAVLVWRRAPLLVAMLAAAAVTAVTRSLGL
jgi:branched-subunit amino acid transport protein